MEHLEANLRAAQKAFPHYSEGLKFAYAYIQSDPGSSLTKSRMIAERVLLELFKLEMGSEPRRPLLGELLADNQFTRRIDRRIVSRLNAIRDMGNLGPHGEEVHPSDAVRVLDDLCAVLEWYLQRSSRASRPSQRDAEGKAVDASTSRSKGQHKDEIIPVKTATDVLIVQDDIDFATLIERTITDHGLSVTLAIDERNAITLAQRYRPTSIVLNPFYCSNTLPEHLRELCPGVRMIALVACSEMPEGLVGRFDSVLNKPVLVRHLMDAIRPPVSGGLQT
jgi:hypothetical protein